MSRETSSPDGLTAVFLASRDRLFRFLLARTRDPSEAEEIVQEIYLRLDRTNGPVADPVGYLHRMALNLVVDRARERARRARREEDWTDSNTSRLGDDFLDESPSPFAQVSGQERAARIGRALASLPPGAARVFRLHRIDGLSHAEVAGQLGISRKGVEKHMSTALRHLAKEIDE